MNRDKQIRFDASRFFNADMQRHKVIAIARQVGSHARCGINASFQLECDCQHHVFFTRAAFTNGTRIFAAVSGVKRDGDHALIATDFRRRGRVRRFHFGHGPFRHHRQAGHTSAFGVATNIFQYAREWIVVVLLG